MTIPTGEVADADRLDMGRNAKCALERVCSGAGLDPPSRYLKSPKNTPSIAVGLDGDEFGIAGASPTIN